MVRLPDEYLVRVLTEPMELFRASHGADQASLRDALSSNYERDRRPPHPVDLHATVLRMAISLFADDDRLTALARRRPDRIGTHVATLQLPPGHGICLADTGSAGHWSVWGIPSQLLECVTEVTEVAC